MYEVEGGREKEEDMKGTRKEMTDKEEESKEKRSKVVHPSQVASPREVLSHPK